ncbi:MAG TPA: hypothetical protein VK721_16690, partial [Solirubrobacteraceae bacterium]|nr:hypothetical protein [Solirubrobacteraceae bacterium]
MNAVDPVPHAPVATISATRDSRYLTRVVSVPFVALALGCSTSTHPTATTGAAALTTAATVAVRAAAPVPSS